MKKLNLKPTHKPIRDYYEVLEQYDQHNIKTIFSQYRL